MKRALAMVGLALWLLGVAPLPSATPRPISIVINGDVLPMQPPPRFEGGHLLVPVRRTIESLGLDFNKSGKMITTHVGARTVTLAIGSRIAHVDGEPVYMDAAAIEIKDVLYAPLRFFTGVLGAQASYDRLAHQVTIVAQLVGRSGAGVTSTKNTIVRIGTVTAVDIDSDPPTVTLTYNASVRTIPIGSNASIEMHDVDANVTVPGELSNVRPGDFARITMLKNGHVTRVEDEYGSYQGRVAAVAANRFVLADGHVIAPSRTTVISINGVPAQIADLQVGDGATVRYNVETNEVREILVSRAVAAVAGAATGPQIASVSSSADRPLRAGESVSVTLRGTPGASATFDIGPYVGNLAMSEGPAGLYHASYQIPAGANFFDVPIIGHLSLGTVRAPLVQAPQMLSASSTPPGVSGYAPAAGQTVNTSRPAVYATFASVSVPVNPSSVLLWVNGRDVTADCVRTAQFIQYMPAYSYPNGTISVRVRVADLAGNTTTKSWSFIIRNR